MTELGLSKYLRSNYDGYYQDGDSEWRRLGAIGKVTNILRLCRGLSFRSVLDIGAGEGSVLERLSELDFAEEFYALEISDSGVEAIRRKRIPRLAECKVFDGYHIPHHDHSFDLAILSHVIEHVEHPRALLYEAARVARFVAVEVPLEDTWRLPHDFAFNTTGHLNFYSAKTFRRLIQSCNLRVLSQLTANPIRETYVFQKGRKGLIEYYIKTALLESAPALATKLFTYHCALLCEHDGSDRTEPN